MLNSKQGPQREGQVEMTSRGAGLSPVRSHHSDRYRRRIGLGTVPEHTLAGGTAAPSPTAPGGLAGDVLTLSCAFCCPYILGGGMGRGSKVQ